MKTSRLSPRFEFWSVALIFLLVLGGLLRLLDITDPPLDFQPSRQLRNSLVARDIYYSLLPSATDEQRELASKFAESVGKYEPPVIETIVALSYFATGGENFAVARVWETFFWLGAGLALFDLVRRSISTNAALLGLAYYLILPFSVQASRSFQPDPLMTSAFIAGIYYLHRWSEEQTWKNVFFAGLFLGLATFVKIVIAFFAGAAAVALVIFTLQKDFWRSRQVWAMAGMMIVPSLVFYILLNQGRSTEYFFAWTLALIKLITSADFYSKWLAFIGSLFGLTIIFVSLGGALLAPARLRWLLISLWIGYLLYGLTLPFQMYTHSYYHIQLIPIVALGLASAAEPILERAFSQPMERRAVFIVLIAVVIGYHAWVARSVLIAEDFHHEPDFWSNVGEQIPADSNTIALTQDYGYRLMLFGWRKTALWPLSTNLAEARNGNTNPAENFIELIEGRDYFLVTAFGQLEKQPQLKEILKQYPIAAEGDGYVLYQLK